MKRAVAQQAGWSAAWCAFERYERERIGLWCLGCDYSISSEMLQR